MTSFSTVSCKRYQETLEQRSFTEGVCVCVELTGEKKVFPDEKQCRLLPDEN